MTTHGGQPEAQRGVAVRVVGGDEFPVPDAELASLASGLDELARVERAAAPGGLSDRLFEATRGALQTRPNRDVVARIGPGSRAWSVAFTPLRAAAGLAVIATVALSLIAGRTSTRSPAIVAIQGAALESEVTEWLALSGDMVGDLAAQINGLDADSASLREQFAGGLPASDLFMDEGAF